MVKLSSQTPELGAPAPDFSLLNPRDGKTYSRDQLAGPKGLIVIFMCNHCPYVKCIVEDLVAFGRDFADTELGICAISANDPVNYPDDAPEKMAHLAEKLDFPFVYLFDETQEVARAYGAVCTPDIFAFGRDDSGNLSLAYAGQFDDTRPSQRDSSGVSGRHLRLAAEGILAGAHPLEEQLPCTGCSIKWRS